MSTPTSETLNGGSTFTPTQTNDANESIQGQLAELARPRMTGGDTTSGMTCGSQLPTITVKPVDSKTLAGSYPGDHRTKAADAKLPDNPAPREQMHGQQNSKFYNENGKGFQSTATDLDSDAGN